MNVIAGILIGWFNETWIARILACFLWGICWCIYYTLSGKVKDRIVSLTLWQLYLVEYLTATTTSLPFALVVGLIKIIFYND